MYTIASFMQILLYVVVISLMVTGILSKVRIPTVKVMLFGIALIVFSNSFLKGAVRYGIDDLISVIGLSFCIVGLLKRDK